MNSAIEILLGILRNAWQAMIGLIAIMVILGMLYKALVATGGTFAGFPQPVAQAIGSMVGVLSIGLYAFIILPALVNAGMSSINVSGGCGPLSDIVLAVCKLIGAIGALRMLRASFVGTVSTMVGSGGGAAGAIIESGEVLIGMLLVSAAAPVAGAFMGTC